MLNHIFDQLASVDNMEVKSYMQKYFLMKETTVCLLCEGYGHVSSNCGTKRRIDALTKGTGMRQYWGRMKSDRKIDFMADKADVALDYRVAEHKRIFDKNNLMGTSYDRVRVETQKKIQSEEQSRMNIEPSPNTRT